MGRWPSSEGFPTPTSLEPLPRSGSYGQLPRLNPIGIVGHSWGLDRFFREHIQVIFARVLPYTRVSAERRMQRTYLWKSHLQFEKLRFSAITCRANAASPRSRRTCCPPWPRSTRKPECFAVPVNDIARTATNIRTWFASRLRSRICRPTSGRRTSSTSATWTSSACSTSSGSSADRPAATCWRCCAN